MGALVLVGSPGIGERCGPPGSFRPRTSHALHYDSELSADTELVDDGPGPSWVLVLGIFEEPPPLADQHQQAPARGMRSGEHTSELQSRLQLVCRLLLVKKN